MQKSLYLWMNYRYNGAVMALIRSDNTISGSQGDTTFSRNRGGAYTRQRTKPTNALTARRLQVRARLTSCSQAWRLLSDAQRLAWTDYAAAHPYSNRVGETGKILSGSAIFNKLNSRVVDFGSALIQDPPTNPIPSGLLTFAATRASSSTITLTFTPTPLPAGLRLQVWMSLPTIGNTNPGLSACVLVGYTAAAPISTVVMTIPRSWATGQTVTFYAAVIDGSGQRSLAFLKCKVTA